MVNASMNFRLNSRLNSLRVGRFDPLKEAAATGFQAADDRAGRSYSYLITGTCCYHKCSGPRCSSTASSIRATIA